MTLDGTGLAIAVIGFAIGFVTGYGVRAFISYRRRKAARLRSSFFDVASPRRIEAPTHRFFF